MATIRNDIAWATLDALKTNSKYDGLRQTLGNGFRRPELFTEKNIPPELIGAKPGGLALLEIQKHTAEDILAALQAVSLQVPDNQRFAGVQISPLINAWNIILVQLEADRQ